MEAKLRQMSGSQSAPVSSLKESYQARGMNPSRLEAVLKYAGRSILDVGCGSGAYVLHLRDRYEIRGVDFRRYDTWSSAPELFSLSGADHLELPDSSVDTVLSFETLEHLDHPGRALKEYYRVCRRNLILTVPNCDTSDGMRRSGLAYFHWTDRTHVQFFTLESTVELASSAGFKIAKAVHINEITLMPLILEMLGMGPGTLSARIAQRLVRPLPWPRRPYCMTTLVVAEK